MPNLGATIELQALAMPSMPRMSAPTSGFRPVSSQPVGIRPVGPVMRGKKFSTTKRKKLAKKGHARPDGSYPIESPKDVGNAVKDWHRSGGSSADKAHIRKEAKRLGLKDPFAK